MALDYVQAMTPELGRRFLNSLAQIKAGANRVQIIYCVEVVGFDILTQIADKHMSAGPDPVRMRGPYE